MDFTYKDLYRRENLVGRTDLEKTPYHMNAMLDRAIGVKRRNCSFEFYMDGKQIPPD